MSDGVGVEYHRNLWCMMNYDSCPPCMSFIIVVVMPCWFLSSFLRALGLCYFGVRLAYDRHWTGSG